MKTFPSFPRDFARPAWEYAKRLRDRTIGTQRRHVARDIIYFAPGDKRGPKDIHPAACPRDVVTSYRGEELTAINRHFCTRRRKIKPAAKFCIMESSLIGRTVDWGLLWKPLYVKGGGKRNGRRNVITLSRLLLPPCLDKYTGVHYWGWRTVSERLKVRIYIPLRLCTMHSRDSIQQFFSLRNLAEASTRISWRFSWRSQMRSERKEEMRNLVASKFFNCAKIKASTPGAKRRRVHIFHARDGNESDIKGQIELWKRKIVI